MASYELSMCNAVKFLDKHVSSFLMVLCFFLFTLSLCYRSWWNEDFHYPFPVHVTRRCVRAVRKRCGILQSSFVTHTTPTQVELVGAASASTPLINRRTNVTAFTISAFTSRSARPDTRRSAATVHTQRCRRGCCVPGSPASKAALFLLDACPVQVSLDELRCFMTTTKRG